MKKSSNAYASLADLQFVCVSVGRSLIISTGETAPGRMKRHDFEEVSVGYSL